MHAVHDCQYWHFRMCFCRFLWAPRPVLVHTSGDPHRDVSLAFTLGTQTSWCTHQQMCVSMHVKPSPCMACMQGKAAGGLALARILHGLHSPAFPREQWSRCGFWGRYADVDFDAVLEVAEAEASGAGQ